MQDSGLALCINSPHQDTDNISVSRHPTAQQNVYCGVRFALANRAGGLKG